MAAVSISVSRGAILAWSLVWCATGGHPTPTASIETFGRYPTAAVCEQARGPGHVDPAPDHVTCVDLDKYTELVHRLEQCVRGWIESQEASELGGT